MPTRKDNRKLAKNARKPRSRTVRPNTNFKLDPEMKKQFQETLRRGVKSPAAPPSMTVVVVALIEAYMEAVKRDGRQPEFPLEVRSKPGAEKR